MRGKRDSDRKGNARSNEYEEGRLNFIRKIYMESHSRIEAKFLAMIRAHDLSSRDKQFSLMSYREGAVEILSAVERIIGPEGLHEISKYLRVSEDSLAGHKEDDEECDEESDEEGGDDYVQTPIDDTPWTFEKVDPSRANPWEHLKGMPRFPTELVDKDEEEPSEPEFEDEEEDDEEEFELDIIERVKYWDEVRGLWKDFDPAYR